MTLNSQVKHGLQKQTVFTLMCEPVPEEKSVYSTGPSLRRANIVCAFRKEIQLVVA